MQLKGTFPDAMGMGCPSGCSDCMAFHPELPEVCSSVRSPAPLFPLHSRSLFSFYLGHTLWYSFWWSISLGLKTSQMLPEWHWQCFCGHLPTLTSLLLEPPALIGNSVQNVEMRDPEVETWSHNQLGFPQDTWQGVSRAWCPASGLTGHFGFCLSCAAG